MHPTSLRPHLSAFTKKKVRSLIASRPGKRYNICSIVEDWSHPPGGRIVSHWAPLHAFSAYAGSEIPLDTQSIIDSWSTLQDKYGKDVASSRYARLLAIDSTELESVFNLAGDSRSQIIRVGFFTAAIDEVAVNSAIKEPSRIVKVLSDIDAVCPHPRSCQRHRH